MTRLPLLLHPMTLGALLVLILNDHWLKYAHPGLVSGKASDVTGVLLVPLLVLGCLELLRMPHGPRAAASICSGSAFAFAAMKLVEGPNSVAATMLGGPVMIDASDLVALPAAFVALLIVGQRSASSVPTTVLTLQPSPDGIVPTAKKPCRRRAEVGIGRQGSG